MNIDKDIELLKDLKYRYLRFCIEGLGEPSDIKEFRARLQAIENVIKELETYKKIAEKLADKLRYEKGMKQDFMFCLDICGDNLCDRENCKQCIIDWAKREVENGK